MPSGGISLGVAEHAGDLVDPILSMQYLNVARGYAPPGCLGNREVAVCPSGDLRQVGDDQDLVTLSHIGQCSRHLNPDFSTDSLIDFIEHQGGDGIVLHQHDLESEHEP